MKRKDNMPDLVFFGLLGINSKSSAYAYLSVSVAIGLMSGYLGLSQPKFFWGMLMFIAAYWYFYSIDWVDKNSSWES